MESSILVTGGAGYIGSHAVKALVRAGKRVVVLDNLCRGHREAVPPEATLLELDLLETDAIAAALREHNVDRVLHFAALTYVGESVEDPLRYYWNNTAGAVSLLQAMKQASVKRLVFSSTAATYGDAVASPIVEIAEQRPINPYGRSKLFVEQILADVAKADPDFSYVALRYFNVAGSAADGSIGEDHKPETHLVPIALQVALGQREAMTIFGEDYPTPDGTCIRDYVHVEDLIDAHLLALDRLDTPGGAVFNVGIGRGYSVQEVLDAVRRVTGHALPAKVGARRAGDPAELWASGDKLRTELGWSPKYDSLDAIVETAWRWFQSHPNGYAE